MRLACLCGDFLVMYQPHTHKTGISRWAQMSADVLIRCSMSGWNKQILDTNLDLSLLYNRFFILKFLCLFVGGFAAEVNVGLSEGFRSSLSLSNVLLALFLSVCLFLRTVRPSHLSWLRSGPLQMHKLLDLCRNWAEVFTFPERLFFVILTALEGMREL